MASWGPDQRKPRPWPKPQLVTSTEKQPKCVVCKDKGCEFCPKAQR